MVTVIISNVRPWGKSSVDLAIVGGRIAEVRPPRPGASLGGDDVDGRGRIVVPSFSDVHVHLDSTRVGLPFREHTGGPGLWPLVMNDREHWREDPSPQERATETLGRMIARGATTIRTYAQVDVDCTLERFEGVVAAKNAHQDRCDVTIMAFPQAGLLQESGSAEVLEQALRAGADVVGGIDPCQLDRDPVRHLDTVFGLAEKYGLPVDIHLHEPAQLALFSTELIIERVRALSMEHLVTISHGYDLWELPEKTCSQLIETFADLDISLAGIAPATPSPLPLPDLASAGIRVGLGEDGQRDFWSPYGDCDMLQRSWQLAFTGNYRRDDLIEHCVAVATVGGRAVVDYTNTRLTSVDDRPGIGVGDPADLVLLEGDTVVAAVMDQLPGRTVVYHGTVVAEDLALV